MKSNDEYKQNLKFLIAEDKIDDLYSKLFENLRKFMAQDPKHGVDDVFNKLVLNKGSYTSLRDKENSNLIPNNQLENSMNSNLYALIYIIDKLPENFLSYCLGTEINKTEIGFEKEETIDFIQSSNLYPSSIEVEKFTNALHSKNKSESLNFLIGISNYFMNVYPSRIDDNYVKRVEKLLNEIYIIVDKNKWDSVFEDIISDSLGFSSYLVQYVDGDKNPKYFKNLKKLGKSLAELKEQNQVNE